MPVRRCSLVTLAILVAWSTGFAALSSVDAGPGASAARGSHVAPNDGRAVAGGARVIVAQDEPRHASPSGAQVLRIVGPTEGPQTLDPALTHDLRSTFLVRQVYSGLTRFNRNLEPVPAIADRIEISADGLEYTFSLRQGAAFQDGRPIKAAAVVFSLTRAIDPATAGGDAAALAGPTFLSDIEGAQDVIGGHSKVLRGVTTVDAQTVRIRLTAPRSTFLMKLASAPASIVDGNDVARGGDWWKAPNGSGPFHIAEWVPDDHLTLTPFDGFFGGPPTLKRVEVRLGANALQPFNLYQAGQVDLTEVDLTGIDRALASESGLKDQVTVTPLFAVDYIAFRTDAPPMDDPAIRKAVQLAFSRDKVADVSYDGHVSRASGLIPQGMLGVDWPARLPSYDLSAARIAIAGSKYGAPDKVPPIRVYVSGYTYAESLRDTLAADLGLTVEVISVRWSDFVDGLARRSYPAYELYWAADFPDPESFLGTLFGTGRADNYVDYSNPKMDELLHQAASEQDAQRRIALYAQAQQILLDDLVVIPLFDDVAYTLAKPSVKGLDVTPLGILRLDSVWLEH